MAFLIILICNVAYAFEENFTKALSLEVERLKDIGSVSFDFTGNTITTSQFEGISRGYTQQTKFSYWSKKGLNSELVNPYKYDLWIINDKSRPNAVVDMAAVYNQSVFSSFDRKADTINVDTVIPGPYNLLRDKAGIFLPLRFLAPMENGKPERLDGFLLSINYLQKFKDSDLEFLPLSDQDAAARSFYGLEPVAAVRYESGPMQSAKTQTLDCYYIVTFSDKGITGWAYFEEGKPIESFKLNERFESAPLAGLMSKGEMTYFHKGHLVSHAEIEIKNLKINEEIPDELFEMDPSLAKYIYDRKSRKLIEVPR